MMHELTRTQKNLLRLLKEFDRICKSNSITYYLAGGCFLGAVRNGGFIPWDDDADVHMTRDEAYRLLDCKDDFPSGRVIIRKEEYPEFHHDFWRYMDVSDTVCTPMSSVTDVPSGQYIDIFILDPVYGEEDQRTKTDKKTEMYKELRNALYVSDSMREQIFFKEYKQLRNRLKTEGKETVLGELLKETENHKEYDNNDFYYYKVRRPGKSLIVHKDIFGEPLRIKFEDLKLPVVSHPEEFLEQGYKPGWMYMPKMSSRNQHPLVKDFDLPYTVYDEEIKKYLDKKEACSILEEKKDVFMELASQRNICKPVKIKILASVLRYKLLKKEQEKKVITKAVDSGDISLLKKIFKEYYHLQLSVALFYKAFVDITDKLLYAAMLPLLYVGEYYIVDSVLDLRQNQGNLEIDEQIVGLKKLSHGLVELEHCMYVTKDYKRAEEIVGKNICEWRQNISLLRADIFLRLKKSSDIRNTEKLAIEYMKEYPCDGELLKLFGDILFMTGRKKEAIQYYHKASGLTRNAIVLSDIGRRMEEIKRAY